MACSFAFVMAPLYGTGTALSLTWVKPMPLALVNRRTYNHVMELRDLLKQAGLFRGMSDDSTSPGSRPGASRKASGRAAPCSWREPKDQEFFLLLEGEVRLYKTSPEGQEVALRIVRPARCLPRWYFLRTTCTR